MKLSTILERSFKEIYHTKDQWFDVKGSALKDLKDNLFALVDGVYRPIYDEGHVSFTNPHQIDNSDFWEAIDNDDHLR